MALVYVLLGAVALLIVIVFSVQNAGPVTVWFYNWKFNASLAIVVFLSVVAGMALEGFFIASLRLRKGIRRRKRTKTILKEEQSQASPVDVPRTP